jgi:3-deoxy-D-manno-octulosonate 8-phosphate phosphatase (KDO 8-P phosphatase)
MGNRARARRIKMVLSDVDGTLTDGKLAVLPDGEEVKTYNVKDGMAVLLAQLAGLKLGLITGKTSKGLEHRARRLKIDDLYQGALDKRPALAAILAKHGLEPGEIAYLGDDLGDLPLLEVVGLAAVVADAHPGVRKAAHFICKRRGGDGAFRELVDFIIGAQGKWGLVTAGFGRIFDRKI